jgi:hypothetical protein
MVAHMEDTKTSEWPCICLTKRPYGFTISHCAEYAEGATQGDLRAAITDAMRREEQDA